MKNSKIFSERNFLAAYELGENTIKASCLDNSSSSHEYKVYFAQTNSCLPIVTNGKIWSYGATYNVCPNVIVSCLDKPLCIWVRFSLHILYTVNNF